MLIKIEVMVDISHPDQGGVEDIRKELRDCHADITQACTGAIDGYIKVCYMRVKKIHICEVVR